MRKVVLWIAFLTLRIPTLDAKEVLSSHLDVPPVLQPLHRQQVDLKKEQTVHGLQVWSARKGKQKRTLYVTEDGQALLMGTLYTQEGTLYSENSPSFPVNQNKSVEVREFWQDIERSRWIGIGSESAPPLYLVADPSCEHCRGMLESLLLLTEQGKLQIRVILVSLLDEKSEEAVSFIFSQEDPAQALRAYNKNPTIRSKQAFTLKSAEDKDRHNALLLKWNLTSTPLSIFKNREGSVKVIEGVPQKIHNVIQEIEGR